MSNNVTAKICKLFYAETALYTETLLVSISINSEHTFASNGSNGISFIHSLRIVLIP